MKNLLALLLLIPSLSWGSLNFDNFYEQNDYELNSIAHCTGFLQGIVDITSFMMTEYEEEVETQFSEEEKDEVEVFLKKLNKFNDITRDEMDFQLKMQCGKDIQCRTKYANIVVEGFTQGFDNIYMFFEKDDDGLSDAAEEYLSDSDIILDLCFNNADN